MGMSRGGEQGDSERGDVVGDDSEDEEAFGGASRDSESADENEEVRAGNAETRGDASGDASGDVPGDREGPEGAQAQESGGRSRNLCDSRRS